MRAVTFSKLLLSVCLIASSLAACATRPPASDPDALAEYEETNDPLEPTNRVFYVINNGIDTVLLRPVAQAYRFVFPQPVRNGVHNLLANLSTPVLLGNDILEAKPRRAGDTTMRFLINTTVGVVGVFDVAKDWGYPALDSSFGTTLAGRGGLRSGHGDGPLHLGRSGRRGGGAQLVALRRVGGRSARAGA